ncbi:hypothetical protein HH310_30650 [Actinoplanes sp. TBRC 11911]|uniref:hypothetical protein n=1 Tax=Actinoplanes sp. TBRC 11911 TaxID=2729386 RepID=UPI00145C9A0F|nr:hypothetical protein [Actinoplanes sp. TBRC 11911]NMO55532.1 hypothetical protein [Actinoplanes sp. TBRC 11911]
MAHIDQVLGPDDDTVTFFQPRAMVFVTMLWVVTAVWALALALFAAVRLALGIPSGAGDLIRYLEVALIVPMVFTALILLVAWRRLGWLHSSMRGLDFAATGRRAVHVPWAGVGEVRLRGWGPFTELVVTPVDDQFAVVGDSGRSPRMRGRAYLVDVGLMSPGPRVLLAELHRRLPSKV